MYLNHFALRHWPFDNIADSALFFEGGGRNTLLDALLFSLMRGEGLLLLVGEAGSGKTLLARKVATALPEGFGVVFLLAPSLCPDNLSGLLLRELGLAVPEEKGAAFQELTRQLMQLHEEGRRLVVFMEEAHRFSPALLEEVRLLNHLESQSHKLLQMVLVSHTPLSMSGLADRVDRTLHIPPFNQEEVGDYLDYRMGRAGWQGEGVFHKQAIRTMTTLCQGRPRLLNTLAHYALLAACAGDKRIVGHKELQLALPHCPLVERGRKHGWRRSGSILVWTALLALGVAGVVFQQRQEPPPVVVKPVEKIAPVVVAPEPPPPQVVVEPPPPPPPVVEESPPEVTPPPPVEPPAASALTSRSTVDTVVVLGGVPLSERIRRSQEWLLNTPDERVSVQLLLIAPGGPDPVRSLVKLFQDTEKAIQQDQLRIFPLKNGGFLVYYGEYAGITEAKKDIALLPNYLQRTKPFGQSLNLIKRELARIAVVPKSP
ncbi:MAG: AAA family ATPase [Magnetococcales bacterium]|nr:AAA family ATPase [Magnetococcales bacterium]